MSLKDKTQLLTNEKLLTQSLVAKALGLKPGSAANLLTQWSKEGLIQRTGPGYYVSKLVKDDNKTLLIETLEAKFGKNLVLVGGSAWERFAWCDSPTLHVAIPTRPSRYIPRVHGAQIYPVGAKLHQHLLKNSVRGGGNAPPALHPIAQMLWWMEDACPVAMPAPAHIHWEKFQKDPELLGAVKNAWPELKNREPLDIAALYEMIHMDRLTGTVAGQAEDLDEGEEENGERPGS